MDWSRRFSSRDSVNPAPMQFQENPEAGTPEAAPGGRPPAASDFQGSARARPWSGGGELFNPKGVRRLAWLDVIGIPLLVELYIWRLQFAAPACWLIFPVWLVASFFLHGDTPATLGWRFDNLWPATKQTAVFLVASGAALGAVGLALGAPRHLPAHLLSPWRLWSYFAFCLLQQVVSQSFLANRLLSLIPNRWGPSLLVGAIFALAHWPNPVLVPVTFVGGTFMAWLFARHRNIIPLAAAQALLGSQAWWTFPVAWHHHMRVGPGFYRPL